MALVSLHLPHCFSCYPHPLFYVQTFPPSLHSHLRFKEASVRPLPAIATLFLLPCILTAFGSLPSFAISIIIIWPQSYVQSSSSFVSSIQCVATSGHTPLLALSRWRGLRGGSSSSRQYRRWAIVCGSPHLIDCLPLSLHGQSQCVLLSRP